MGTECRKVAHIIRAAERLDDGDADSFGYFSREQLGRGRFSWRLLFCSGGWQQESDPDAPPTLNLDCIVTTHSKAEPVGDMFRRHPFFNQFTHIKVTQMPTTFFAGISRYTATTATAMALAACGGGGSDAPAPTPAPAPSTAATTTFPLAAAMASYAKDTRTVPFTVTGTGTGNGQTIAVTGSGNVVYAIVAGTFEGAPAQVKTAVSSSTLTIQGNSSAAVDTSMAFYDSNYQPLGTSSDFSYCVTSGATAFPASVKVGDTGTWYAASCYTSKTKAVRIGPATLTYAIEPLTATSVVLRIIAKSTPQTGAVTTQDVTYTITTAGTVSARETPIAITARGVALSLVFKYL